MTKAEASFLDQMTRKRMVDCADWITQARACNSEEGFPSDLLPEPYKSHGLGRGWVSKRDNSKLTGAGFSVAASFLKR